jgi:hypothetical protein
MLGNTGDPGPQGERGERGPIGPEPDVIVFQITAIGAAVISTVSLIVTLLH